MWSVTNIDWIEPLTGNSWTSSIVNASNSRIRPIDGMVSSGFRKAVPTRIHFLAAFAPVF